MIWLLVVLVVLVGGGIALGIHQGWLRPDEEPPGPPPPEDVDPDDTDIGTG